MTAESNKPVKEFKVGAVRAAIWTNTRQTRTGTPFNSFKVQLERIYKDNQGEYQKTSSLDPDDIPRAILSLQKCYEYIAMGNEKKEFQSAAEIQTGGDQQ